MEENSKNLKISFVKNMNKITFNSVLSIPVDSNANIKTILDLNTYIFDQKVECGNGKAILTGKIGAKILYIDTDNITNTISASQNFSETYVDNSITNETYVNIFNSSIVNTILSSEGIVKISCDVSITPTAYVNLGINNNIALNETLITKKSEIKTNSISKVVNTKFEQTSNIETKDSISKILCCNNYFTYEKTLANNNYATVEGKISSYIVYETIINDETLIKEVHSSMPIKYDVNIDGLTSEDILDLSFILDNSNDNISTEVEDNVNVIVIQHSILVSGVVLKDISIDVVDDMYCLNNEIETSTSNREYNKVVNTYNFSEVISNEISLLDSETAIDDIVANLNIIPETTNTYIKNNEIYIEGIISSSLCYIDENKEYKHKAIEIPFIINTKIPAESISCTHSNISVLDNKIKVKRGTIIEIEYSLFINLFVYEKETLTMIDNFKIGKAIDFNKFDFQIFIAKQNETIWELCKRIKISPDDIYKYNNNLPQLMEGGEKIIVKR